MKLKTTILAALLSGAAVLAHAQSGSFNIYSVNSVTFTPSSDVSVATVFNIGDLYDAGETTKVGDFSSLNGVTNHFGSITFTPSSVAGLQFGNALFGTFTATRDALIYAFAGHVDYRIFGNYTSGTFDGGAIVNTPASIDLGFAGSGGFAQLSGSFQIPPGADPTPEPSTMALAALGGASLLLIRRRKANLANWRQ